MNGESPTPQNTPKGKILLWVTTSFVGFHRWPNAPEQVSFLRNLHRHKFGVKVTVEVGGSDREVEFFILKKDVERLIQSYLLVHLHLINSMSCEQMAIFLSDHLEEICDYSVFSVQVDEDGENGALYFPNVYSPDFGRKI